MIRLTEAVGAYSRPFLFGAVLCTPLFAGCASTMRVDSHPALAESRVDGKRRDDWVGGLTLVEKENLWLGFRNDQDYLYLLLTTTDRDVIFSIASGGLIVWFDPAGGKEKVLGFRYPVGMEGAMKGSTPGAARPDPGAFGRLLEVSADGFEVLRRDGPPLRLASRDTLGVQVAASIEDGAMVYEMRVPLRSGEAEPFAVDGALASGVGVGFETPEMKRPVGGGPGGGMPEGMPPGVPPQGGMPPGGGRPGMGPGARPSTPEPLDLWVVVNLQ